MAISVQVFRKDVYPPRWPNGKIGHQFAPPDTPACGFRGELCTEGQGQYAYTKHWNISSK